jgi:transcriptional regulator with XRE-family HTH domain
MPESSIGGRIRIARGGASQKRTALLLDVGITTLQRWENNVTSPTVDSLNHIAKTLGVNACWLLTGEGVARGESPSPAGREVDTDFLTQIIEGVEAYLDEQNAELPADKKAGLITLLYDHFHDDGKINPKTFKRYLKLVA